MCNPHSSSAWILVLKERAEGGGGGGGGGGGSTKILNCTSACLDGTCGLATGDLNKRHHDVSFHHSTHLHHWIHSRQAPRPELEHVELRAPDRTDFDLEVLVQPHPSVRQLPSDHDGLQNTAEFENPDDCSDTTLKAKGTWNSLRTLKFQSAYPAPLGYRH